MHGNDQTHPLTPPLTGRGEAIIKSEKNIEYFVCL